MGGKRTQTADTDAAPRRSDRVDPAHDGPPRVDAPLSPSMLLSLQRTAGNRAVTELLAHPTPIPRHFGNAVIQRVRGKVEFAAGPISLAALEDLTAQIDTQIAELVPTHPEVKRQLVPMGYVVQQRAILTTVLGKLRDENPDPAGYTFDQIRTGATAVLKAFKPVMRVINEIAQLLNNSLATFEEKFAPEVVDQPSPYAAQVGRLIEKLGGAVVLVEGHFVVVVEKYQGKHNPDLVGLLGPYQGKRGSTLKGGWDAHVNTYAKQVLEHAKVVIAEHEAKANRGKDVINTKKEELGDIDAYITITREGADWIIQYHGNPPGEE